jgi:hypothetical protein
MLTAVPSHGITFKVCWIRISNKITGIKNGLEVMCSKVMWGNLTWVVKSSYEAVGLAKMMLTAVPSHGITFKVCWIRISNKITGIKNGLEVMSVQRWCGVI